MSQAVPIIQTENLSKAYRKAKGEAIYALKNLNLSVQPGEIFGYLGPNGAGKTTTIRLLLDIIRPTSGHGRIFGQDAQQHSVDLHRRIGFLPGELTLWKNYSGQQVVGYIGRIRGGVDAGYVKQLAARLELDLNLRVRSYSTGNKRKLGLMLALMNKPELLILDEPTSGLDPLMQQIFNELMLDVQKEGRTVFLSSHILSEVQAICDRVGILRGGELKAVERVSDLTHADFRWVEVRFKDSVLPNALANVAGVSEITTIENGLRLRLHGDFDPLMRALAPYYVKDVRMQEPSLEEIFLTFYGNNGSKPQIQAHKEMAS